MLVEDLHELSHGFKLEHPGISGAIAADLPVIHKRKVNYGFHGVSPSPFHSRLFPAPTTIVADFPSHPRTQPKSRVACKQALSKTLKSLFRKRSAQSSGSSPRRAAPHKSSNSIAHANDSWGWSAL